MQLIARFLAGHPQRLLAIVALGAAIAMIPWTILLGLNLPAHYVTTHWSVTWVGFDTAEIVGFTAIAATAWLRSRYLATAAMVTATLLACDAWFDITTASPRDLGGSLLMAVGEIPIALGLAALVARRIRRRQTLALAPAEAVTSPRASRSQPAMPLR